MTALPPAPKSLDLNIKYRRAILARCATDEVFREHCWVRASRDFVWWCDTFGWIYCPKDHPEAPNQPFILYPYQEKAATDIIHAITVGKHDLLIEKSRDMGCTWLVIMVILWLWMFRKGQSFLWGSRKQEYVDKSGDPKSLFWKWDFALNKLPVWMRPRVTRNSMHSHNHDTDSTSDGESTNDDFGRGDRRTAIPLDEFPAVDNGQRIMAATRDATNCRLLIGTPQGAFGAFFEMRTKMAATNPERIITLHWSLHPEKAAGLYTSEKDGNGAYQLVILDYEYKFPENYPHVLDGKKRSPWYDEQERRAVSKQELAQEVDIDYAASAWQYFDPLMVNDWIAKFACAPFHTGDMLFDGDWKTPIWEEQAGGKLELWFHPTPNGRVPDAWNDIVAGVDTATGQAGEMSSNSVASFTRSSTGEKIAQYTANDLFPTDFALKVLAIARWMNDCLIVPERNGPGGELVKTMVREGYTNLYRPPKDEMRGTGKREKAFGWWTDRENKKLIFSDLRNAYRDGTFINHSEPALNECKEYIFDGNKIEHSRALSSNDPTVAGENHGDMCISDALSLRGAQDRGQSSAQTAPTSSIPENCALARRQARESRMLSANSW